MHVAVFGIESNTDHIQEFNANSLDREDGFVASHYDWWTNYKGTGSEIAEELVEALGLEPGDATIGLGKAGTYIVFKQSAINKYFQRMWKGFKAALDKLNGIKAEGMRSYYLSGFSEMESVLDDTWNAMVYSYDDGWLSPQDFMRGVKPRKRYYITGAVDAHW